MFVFSLRANKPKIIIALCVLAAVLIALTVIFSGENNPVTGNNDITAKASDSAERIAFLSQFGWKINEEPVEVTEVIIPSEFNETYTEYNELQKQQAMNLEPYKGLRVKKWVYEVLNYPGYPAESNCIRATLLIYDGMVIGGDVSSLEMGSFMQGFDYPVS